MLTRYDDPRDATFEELYKLALADKDLIVLSADTGARKFGDFKKNIPRQYFNVGISEQNMISVASGLTAAHKKVFVFGIGCFVTSRCYEQIKIDVCCMKRPVTIIGMGTGYGYSGDGPTHHVTEDLAIMRVLGNLYIWSPSDCTSLSYSINEAYRNGQPNYIRFDKQLHDHVYDVPHDFSLGLDRVRRGDDVVIVATSIMTSRAIKIIDCLERHGVKTGLIDIYRIKPFNRSAFYGLIKEAKRLIVLDENHVDGGLCSLVRNVVCDYGLCMPVKVFGIPDGYHSLAGSREYILSLDHLDQQSIVTAVLDWLKEHDN